MTQTENPYHPQPQFRRLWKKTAIKETLSVTENPSYEGFKIKK